MSRATAPLRSPGGSGQIRKREVSPMWGNWVGVAALVLVAAFGGAGAALPTDARRGGAGGAAGRRGSAGGQAHGVRGVINPAPECTKHSSSSSPMA